MTDAEAPPWDDAPWVSWSGDLSVLPRRHYYPTSLDQLREIVREAERQQPPSTVHAAGSCWSFSGPSATSGFMVETKSLARTLHTDITRTARSSTPRLSTVWGSDTVGLYHVEAGVQIYEVCRRLDGRRAEAPPTALGTNPLTIDRWALPTMGGSSGQTLIGAISTSTHGADVGLPPLCDAVQALHLVGPGGRHHWIERTDGVTTDAAVLATYPDIQIHRDDDMLQAAVVSLGRFGIIYSVLIAVVPQFALRSKTRKSDWAAVAAELANGALLESHRAVQVVVSLYPHGRQGDRPPDRACYITTRDLAEPPVPRARSATVGRVVSRALNAGGSMLRALRGLLLITWVLVVSFLIAGLGAAVWATLAVQVLLLLMLPAAAGRLGDVVGVLCDWANRHGRWRLTAALVKVILALAQRPITTTGVGYQVMAGAPWVDEYYRGHSVEVFFDATTTDYLAIIADHLLPAVDARARAGNAIVAWFSLRYTARSSAMLAMQQWDRTVSVEVAALRGVGESVAVLREIEAAAVAHGGRVHWGQQHDLDAAAVDSAFPRLTAWRAQLRALCTTEREQDTFDNDFCRARGLVP